MKTFERFAAVLARHICARSCQPRAAGSRLLVSGFPDGTIELAADVLAGSIPTDATLKAKNVVLVLDKTEYALRERSTRASVAGVSYCVNVRDSGETAVFFVRRALMPLVEESLGARGSVQLARLGVTPNRVMADTVEECFRESKWAFDDPVHRAEWTARVKERCSLLLGEDRTEELAFAMMDEFFRCEPADAADPRGFTAIGLVPQAGDDDSTVKANIAEIDALRSALAEPAKRSAHMEELRAYDSELTTELEEFLDRHAWRVPLESDRTGSAEPHGADYQRFFSEWPLRCTLSFLTCRAKGTARVDVKSLRGGSGRQFDKVGSVWIVDEDEISIVWSAFQLDGCAGTIATGSGRQVAIDDLAEGRVGPIPAGETGFDLPVGRQVELKLLPAKAADRRRLREKSNNRIDVVRLAPSGEQAVVVLGGELAWVLAEKNGAGPNPPPKVVRSKSISVKGVLYDGRQRSDKQITVRYEEGDEEVSEITVEDGSPVRLKVEWSGLDEAIPLEIELRIWGDGKPKRFNSLLGALRSAAEKVERPLSASAAFEVEWATFPHFRVSCSGMTESEFQLTCEAAVDWTKDLLDEVLSRPDLVGPRAAFVHGGKADASPDALDTRDGIPWGQPWTNSACDAFMEARRELFAALREEEEPLPFLRLQDFAELIRKYARCYLNLLSSYLKSSTSYDPAMAYYSAVDGFVLVQGMPLPDDGRLRDADLARAIILLAPTHPVRLLWLLRRELLCEDLFRTASHKQSIDLVSTLDGFGFPPSVVLPDGTVFGNIGFPRDAFWGAYASEGAQFDQALEFLAELFAGQEGLFENPEAPAPGKILAAMDYVHRVFPYRRVLRVRYPEPGTAFSLKTALSEVPDGAREDESSGLHNALFSKRRTSFAVDLQGGPGSRTGRAFARADAVDVDEGGDLPRVELKRTALGRSAVPRSDLTFAEETAGREHGAVLPLDRCPAALPLDGLVCPLIVRSHLNEEATGEMLYGWVHPRPGSFDRAGQGTSPEDARLGSEISHAVQTAFREPKADATIDASKARATKVAYRQAVLDRVRSMQSSTGFLFTLDTNSDLAMFEQMASSGDTIIVDFDTTYHNPVARALSKASHNYIITSSAYTPVTKRLQAELEAGFGNGNASPGVATNTLFRALNGLSGRFLKELLQTPTDVKETIGCGLTSLLVTRAVAGKAAPQAHSDVVSISALIPIDDHFARWSRLAGRQAGKDPTIKADLLFVTVVTRGRNATVDVWPRILEVKFGYPGDRTNAAAKGYAQIRNTWEVLKHWLQLRSVPDTGTAMCYGVEHNAESRFAQLDLASTLDFYLRRAPRLSPGLVARRSASDMEVICNAVYDSIAKGDVRFLFDAPAASQRGAGPDGNTDMVVGTVLHFDPSCEVAPLMVPMGQNPSVQYKVVDRRQCMRLLSGEAPNEQ